LNSDGSATHQGGFQASGKNGSIQSSGSAQRDANGNIAGQRSTTAQGANGSSYQGSTTYGNGTATHTTSATGKNGDTYQGQTTYTKGQGVQHSGTCKDASGNVIPCKN
jgi:hypothetical protein